MARPPKLKVFCTPVGFYNAVVAVPSQKAALRAWGISTDLFAAGRASVVDDPDTQAQALARPGEVLKLPRGDAQALIAAMEREEAAEKKTVPRPAKRTASVKPPPADRSELDRAERALAEAEAELASRLESIAAERAALDERATEERREGEGRIRSLRRMLGEVRERYLKAGGRN